MFDDYSAFIPVEMLMLLYTGETMIIRGVKRCTSNMMGKVLLKLVNEKTQTVFFCFHSCELQ